CLPHLAPAPRRASCTAVPQRRHRIAALMAEALAFTAKHLEVVQRMIVLIAVFEVHDVARTHGEIAPQELLCLALLLHPVAVPRAALSVEPAGGRAVGEADVPVREQSPAPVAGLLVLTRCPSRHHCPAATRPAAAAALCASR